MAKSSDVQERRKAAEQLFYFGFLYKWGVWEDIHHLTHDGDKEVRWMAAGAIGRAFSEIPDKDTAWSDLHQLIQDDVKNVRWWAINALGNAFSDIPDKNIAWSYLHQHTQDEDKYMRQIAADAIGRAFSDIPDKDTAEYDLHSLTQDEGKEVRLMTVRAIGRAFSDIFDKDTAGYDLHRLTQDKDKKVRRMTADVLGDVFSDAPDKDTAWSDLHQLTQDEDKEVRMQAYHSLGSASVSKATVTEDEKKFRDEIKKAIDYFESSSRESLGGSYNPARFCLPFYRSYYAIISEKKEAESEAKKYLEEAKEATGRSENREALLKAVEYLANALNEAQKPMDFGETKEYLRVCRQHCDHTAELADSTREKSPVAAAAIMRGIPIVGMKVKEIIAEIQEKAREACQQAQGTPTEEIACAVNQEVQKWHIDNQEDMTQKVDNLVFSLKSKIPNNPQNKHIHEEIDKIREESNMTRQYEMVSLLIALIPTASVHTGDVINADITASGESQVVVKGNENQNASDNAPASKKSLINWINSPATIAAFVGFMCAEIGMYYYPVTYNHLISVVIAGLVFIIVAIFDKE